MMFSWIQFCIKNDNQPILQNQLIKIFLDKIIKCSDNSIIQPKLYDIANEISFNTSIENFFFVNQNEWISKFYFNNNYKKMQQMIENQNQKKQIQHQNFQYDQFMQLQQNECIYTIQISQDEQYLAYGGDDQLLIIYDLKVKQKLQQIKLQQEIYVCQFSENFALLFVGCRQGYLYCIDIKNNYKLVYQQQIQKDYIINMVVINNHQVITCSSQDIMLTDILQNQHKKIENAHNSCINGLDYDVKKEMIASGSNDKSIKFFNLYSGQIMSKEEAHSCEINQIQFISQNKLLSLDGKCQLRQWQINQKNDDIILITQIQEENSLTNFTYVWNNLIILVCDDYIKMVDEEFNQTVQIKHSQGKDVLTRKVKQTLKYLIIPGENQFTVMKNVSK
ncbi:hypothetical protein pb186bvf_009221 [Paramecium bursaria]